MNTAEAPRFKPLALEVKERSVALFRELFENTRIAHVDYLTLFPADQQAQISLTHDAAWFGAEVAQKNGGVRKVNDGGLRYQLGTPYVRIREPKATALLGCADFVTADYKADKMVMQQQGVYSFSEELKETAEGQPYYVAGVTDYDRGVAVYVPSVRVTEVVMGLVPERL